MSKVLHITDSYIKLPDDFDGTLADALFIFYQSRAKSEQLKEINIEKNINLEQFLQMENKKYSITYEFLEN